MARYEQKSEATRLREKAIGFDMVDEIHGRLYHDGRNGFHCVNAASCGEGEKRMKQLLTNEDVWPLIRKDFPSLEDYPMFDASLVLETERGWLNVKFDSPHKKIPVMRRITLKQREIEEMYAKLRELMHLPQDVYRLELTLTQNQLPLVKLMVHPMKRKMKE